MRIQQRLSLCIILIMLLSLLGMVPPVNVTAQGMPEIGEIGEDQSPPVVGIQSTINGIYVWFGKEYGKTTIWLRACSDAPNFQLRSEQPGHWITEIFNRTTKEGGCSPATNSAWRMVYNADPGEKFNIYATASESWYGEAEFMARALRTTCTVTGYGTGYCTPSNYLSPVSVPRGWIDEPVEGTILTGVFTISGWALDAGSESGTGVDSVHVYFNDTFLGTAYYGTPRSDVAVLHGDSRYTNSGWRMSLDTASLPAGPGVLRVAYRSTISGVYTWMDRNVVINPNQPNQAPNPPTLIAPANAVTVTTPNLTLAIQDGGDPDNGPRPYRDFVFRITKSDNSWSAESGWTTSTSWNVTLPGHGEYHWQAMAGDGATISAWAGPRSLFYVTPPPTSYTISGQIRTDRGDPLLGVIISDGTRRTTTDENGRYILENVPAGNYTLTPTKAGYRFEPVTRNVTVIGNLTGQDFMAISTESSKPWTFMLYLDGDNNLYPHLQRAVAQLESQPANPNVNILVLFDGDRINDSWRFLVQPGGNYTIGVNKWYLGELNMGNPQTLVDFINWTRQNYPAQHYYLAIADHGHGTRGVAWDVSNNRDNLTTAELRTALQIATNSGQWKIDVLHYDACLMALLENAYQVREYADYLVASQNLGWSVFAYEAYAQVQGAAAQGLSAPYEFATVAASVTAATTPRQLAVQIADSYFNHPAIQNHPRTISALDLSRAGEVRQAIDTLANALRSNLQGVKTYVQNARYAVQKFDSRDYYKITQEDEYVDLYHLAALLKQYVPNGGIQAAAQGVMDVLSGGFVVVEHHQSGMWGREEELYWDLENAHGVSLYFPPSSGSGDYNRYVSHQLFRFTADSGWDEFLADYVGVMGLPPEEPTDPGLPPMLAPEYNIFLPFIVRNR